MRAAADVCQANVRTGAAFERLLRAADLAEAAGEQGERAISLAQAVIAANRFPAGMLEDVPTARLTELLDLAERVAPPDNALANAYVTQAAAWQLSPQTGVLSVDPRRAEDALAAARAVHDPVLVSGALDAVLAGVVAGGRMKEGLALVHERMASLADLTRHDPRAATEVSDIWHMLNEQSLAAGELPSALREMRKIQSGGNLALVSWNGASKLLVSLVLTGALEEAAECADEMWTYWLAAGSPTARWMSPAVASAALGAALRGDDHAADEWLRRAQQLVGDDDMFGHRHLAGMPSFVAARRAMHAGHYAAAAELTQAFGANVGDWYVEDGRWFYDAYVWALDAELAVLTEAPDVQARLDAARDAAEENRWAAACLARAHARRTDDRALFEDSIAKWEQIDARFERACTLLLLPDRVHEGRAELAAIGATEPR
jgi:hypothetical protein